MSLVHTILGYRSKAARIEHLERRVNQLDWYQQHIDQVINTLLVRVSTLEDELEELKA